MLRALFALLVLANLLFFAWTQGWLAALWPPPHHGQREPERFAAQVNPERVVVREPPGRSAPVPAARAELGAGPACVEAGPFSDAEVGAAEATLARAGLGAGSWSREHLPATGGWVLYAGRYVDAEARAAREAELRRQGLRFERIDAPPELAPGFVLSRHASRDAAELALAEIANKPLGGVRVMALPPPPLQHWLRVPEADGAQRARLAELGVDLRPCATRP